MGSNLVTSRDGATLRLLGSAGASVGDVSLVGADPLGFEGGDVNLYRYVGNHPTNATDPTGLDEETAFRAGMALSGLDKKTEQALAQAPKFSRGTAQYALNDIKENYNIHKKQISDELKSMFSGLSTDPARAQIEKEADDFAEEYIGVVRRYLETHPGVVPKSTRNGIGDLLGIDKRTNCESWMSYILENMNGKYQHIKMNRGHYQGYVYQHNFVVVRPVGYTPKVYPHLDPNIRILDPWPTLMPYIGPPKYNSYRQVPTTVPGIVDTPN